MVSLIPLFLLFVPIKNIKNLKTFASNLAESGNIKIVGISLIVTGILLITSSIYSKSLNKNKFSQKKMSEMSLIDSLFVGVAQLAASIFPGLSRSGSTLSVGLFRGIKRESALDFSFIMGTPAILAASILEFKEAKELGINIDWKTTFVGMMVSAFVGFLSIKLFKILVSNDRTWVFSVYSLLVGSLILIFGSIG
jgi:undecaprenyl-diphosphatase